MTPELEQSLATSRPVTNPGRRDLGEKGRPKRDVPPRRTGDNWPVSRKVAIIARTCERQDDARLPCGKARPRPLGRDDGVSLVSGFRSRPVWASAAA